MDERTFCKAAKQRETSQDSTAYCNTNSRQSISKDTIAKILYFLNVALFFLFLLPNFTYSQIFNVSGNVLTGSTPVRYASVTFTDKNDVSKKYSTITDSSGKFQLSVVTEVSNKAPIVLQSIELSQNYPNPFSSSTSITYQLNKQSDVNIKIYDILGREVKAFKTGLQAIGTHGIVWDGKDNFGSRLALGIYFYQLQAGKETQVKKMLFGLGGTNVSSPILKTIPSYMLKKENKAQLAAGIFTVHITNTDSTSPIILSAEFPDVEVQQDTTLNFQVQEGSNFFPIGVWLQVVGNADAYKAIGINTFVAQWDPITEDTYQQFKSKGLKLVVQQSSVALPHKSEGTILAWMTEWDEPDNAQWNETTKTYDPCISTSTVLNACDSIKAVDSTLPLYLGLGQGVADIDYIGRGACKANTSMYMVSNNGYCAGPDICAFDIYPVNNDNDTHDQLWYVPQGVDNLRNWDNNKPTWADIETTNISNTPDGQPTPEQMKSEIWMAIVHGAKGITYFCHIFAPSFIEAGTLTLPNICTALTQVNGQITSLASVINSATTSGYASVNSSNGSVPIDIMTKDYGGYKYIFAAAMRLGTTTGTFTVTSGSNAEVIGESRNITISGGRFTDTFNDSNGGYGYHLYKIK